VNAPGPRPPNQALIRTEKKTGWSPRSCRSPGQEACRPVDQITCKPRRSRTAETSGSFSPSRSLHGSRAVRALTNPHQGVPRADGDIESCRLMTKPPSEAPGSGAPRQIISNGVMHGPALILHRAGTTAIESVQPRNRASPTLEPASESRGVRQTDCPACDGLDGDGPQARLHKRPYDPRNWGERAVSGLDFAPILCEVLGT